MIADVIVDCDLTSFIATGVNVALSKPMYANPSGTNLDNAVDRDLNSEAHTGNGNMFFIAVDMESHYVIKYICILIRAAGKLLNW